MENERKRRTFIHKSKVRFKYRVPRKLKKKRNKDFKKGWDVYVKSLIELHGEDKWFYHVIFGG